MISVIIPSINRPKILEKCLRSVFDNIQDIEKEVIVVTEDVNTVDYLEVAMPVKQFDIKLVWHDEPLGYMAAWNEGLKYVNFDIILPIGDDGILVAGALEQVLNIHQSQLGGYGVVGFDDGYIPQEIVCTHFILDKKFIQEQLGGVLLTPHYKAFFADNELNERAKRVGRLKWVKGAYLMHEHSSRGKREMDDIDKKKVEWWEHDQLLFEKRKQQGFPNDFEKVI